MKRKRLTPKEFRQLPKIERTYTAFDPAGNDTIVVYKAYNDHIMKKIKTAMSYETKT